MAKPSTQGPGEESQVKPSAPDDQTCCCDIPATVQQTGAVPNQENGSKNVNHPLNVGGDKDKITKMQGALILAEIPVLMRQKRYPVRFNLSLMGLALALFIPITLWTISTYVIFDPQDANSFDEKMKFPQRGANGMISSIEENNLSLVAILLVVLFLWTLFLYVLYILCKHSRQHYYRSNRSCYQEI